MKRLSHLMKRILLSFLVFVGVFVCVPESYAFAEEAPEDTVVYCSVTYNGNGGKVIDQEDESLVETYVYSVPKGGTPIYPLCKWKDHFFVGWEVRTGSWKGKVISDYRDFEGLILDEDIEVYAYWMKYGWNQVDDDWYYVDENIGFYRGGWWPINNKTYYFLEDGRLAKGWIYDYKYWHYIKDDGTDSCGWNIIDGDWYYFGEYGGAEPGRFDLDGKYYLFSEKGKWINTPGWFKYEGEWYYITTEGFCFSGLLQYNGKSYVFEWPSCTLQRGWLYGDHSTYARSDGSIATGWEQIDGVWYRFSDTGVKMYGWTYDRGKYYYLKKEGGYYTGKKTIDGQEYVFASNGVLTKSDGVYRITYLSKEPNTLVSDGPNDQSRSEITYMIPKGSCYSRVCSASGDDVTLKGWKDPKGKIYTTVELEGFMPEQDIIYTAEWVIAPKVTFDPNGGLMHINFGMGEEYDYTEPFSVIYTKKAFQILSMYKKGLTFFGWYVTKGTKQGTIFKKMQFNMEIELIPDLDTYLEAVWVTPGWNKIGKRWTYVKEDGSTCNGKVIIDGKTYYFDESGLLFVGWQLYDGYWHYFKNDGTLAVSEWREGYWLNSAGNWVYKNKGTWTKGKHGWYFGDTSGWFAKGQWQMIDGREYYFKSNGLMALNEWCNGYWLNKDGTCTYKKKASWKIVGTNWKYRTSDWYAMNQWQKIDGKWYYFDAKGYIVTGTKTIGGKTYTFDKNGVCTNP